MDIQAQWIWDARQDIRGYNVAIIARKTVDLPACASASLAITADSWYRLRVNGCWVADGPCRSWPEHYQYDLLDVSSWLREGENTFEISARYFGSGTFHQVPQQAGILMQLDAVDARGGAVQVLTDATWETSPLDALIQSVPKCSVQMEPIEVYDARRELPAFAPARVVCDAQDGPWQELAPRDCALLTRKPFTFRSFRQANVVRSGWECVMFPVGSLLHPGLVESNCYISMASIFAGCIIADRDMTARIESYALSVTVNGAPGKDGVYELREGPNFLFATVSTYFGHWNRHVWLRLESMEGCHFANPYNPDSPDAWVFAPIEELRLVGDDLNWAESMGGAPNAYRAKADAMIAELLGAMTTPEALQKRFGAALRNIASDLISTDIYEAFFRREVVEDASARLEAPAALMHDNAEWTTVYPSDKGDVELVYDLGEENCGYFDFDLDAPAGTILDVFGVEYIARNGNIQHTAPYRNGMWYICREGRNPFLSLKRRAQRYVLITFRDMTGPVRLRKFQLIESTYPVNEVGSFHCSDAALERIWEIAARTLKLCMEDTFTDCPLYEQTLWVGDARNESVFAFTAFGAEDLAARCIRLAGQSLERYPIVGCQVPSSWDVLLPAWSFLWGISVWDYYYHTADKRFLEDMWPLVLRNLKNSAAMVDKRGLFSGPFWNMFDWTGCDHEHETVLHNSIFAIGATDAALKCADVLGDESGRTWLERHRHELVRAINATWDDARGAFPDSIHEDGSISPSICQHTSFLGLLYDVIPAAHREMAMRNMLTPPEGMVIVGSPFAVMYLYEALEKVGLQDRIIELINQNYRPMLDMGATTVWETFSNGTMSFGEFPTRSHCHAWSSAPIHFLNKIVLGIIPTEAGGESFDISPRLNGLTWARGASASIQGPVSVDWVREGDRLDVWTKAPAGVKLRFVRNDSHAGCEVYFNGEAVPG